MEKFLSVPEVAAGGNEQLVSISDIKLVTQASATQVDILYGQGKTVRLTWPNNRGTAEIPLAGEDLQDAILDALSKGWTNTSVYYKPLTDGYVSGIGIS
jgi:hypothetical protein|tara:strand:- start:8242 stop:8538 length:297 start_codon:yes stop_codon:yes gene_type:complete